MKKIVLIIIFFITVPTVAQNQEVQKVIDTFFEGFHAKDTLKLHLVCSDKIIFQSIMESTKGAKLSNETVKEFYTSIASIPDDFKYEEKILSYSIQVDGTMAHAWTPYEFYINGKLSHSGVNAFTLFRDNNIWKIIYVIDTRRKSL